MITNTTALEHMDEQALRRLAQELLSTVGVQSAALAERERVLTEREQLLKEKDLKIARLTQEISVYRRWRFDKRSEAYKGVQRSLFDEDIDADLAAMQAELKSLLPKTDKPAAPKDKAKRNTFAPELPRTEFHHEPETTTCGCGCALKRIGEDVSEKLDYTPGVFTVERHIRGKWTCAACQTLTQAPVPPHIIDKGIPINQKSGHKINKNSKLNNFDTMNTQDQAAWYRLSLMASCLDNTTLDTTLKRCFPLLSVAKYCQTQKQKSP